MLIVAGASLSLAGGVFCGLALFGGGMGLTEVAFNVEGAAVQSVIGDPAPHGCFSLGTVVGALLGMAMTVAEFPVGWQLTAVAALIAVAAVRAVLSIPHGTGKEAASDDSSHRGGPRGHLRVWRDRRLALIGVIVPAMAFAEGAANDWLPLLTVDGYHVRATAGSLAFLAFAS